MTISSLRTITIQQPPYRTLFEWPLTQPGDDLDYSLDMTVPLNDAADSIASASLAISPSGDGEMQALDLTVNGSVITAQLSGGVAGRNSDGGVTWTYLSTTPNGTRESSGNSIGPNTLVHAKTALFQDGTINHNNTVYLKWEIQQNGNRGSGSNVLTGGIDKKVGVNWSTGLSVTFGELVYTNTGNILYRVTNVGGTTGATRPACTSGTCTTSDGIQGLFIGAGAIDHHVLLDSSDLSLNVLLQVPVLTTNGVYCPIYAGAGSPAGVVTAPPCAEYLNSSGGAGTTLYIKESGTGTSGWVAK
jgi:hypothetical protein